jgi:hypothetical protein
MFLLFSTNFQSFSKTILLFGTRFYYFLRFSTNFQSFGNTLERTRETQCSPWAWRAARLTGIGRLRWRPWPGKGWGRTRGLPTVDLWSRMGGGAPAAGRPAAHREHGHDGLCSGELPAWDEPRATQGGCRGSRATAKRVGLRRYWSERRLLGGARRQCHRHELRRARGARRAVFYRQGAATGHRLQCRGTAAILPCMHMSLATDRWTSRSGYDAVRRCGSHSKDARREGDQRP